MTPAACDVPDLGKPFCTRCHMWGHRYTECPEPVTAAEGTPPDAAYLVVEGDFRIKQVCAYPAPLAANGALFVGCQLDKGHDGRHKVEITWGTS